MNTQNMDNWVICLLSLVRLSLKLGLISGTLSVLPICLEEGAQRGLMSQTAAGNRA